jgi:hypothetical protein
LVNSKTSTQRLCKWLISILEVPQKPPLKHLANGLRSHHKMQGAKEAQRVQGAIESVVKRLEIGVGAIAITHCKERSVRWNTEKKGRSFLMQVALYNKGLQRNVGKRYYQA